MSLGKLARRFFVPSSLVSLYYFIKFGCKISLRAEVELSPWLKIGKNTRIGSFTKIKASSGPLEIGSNCSVGVGCSIGSGKGGLFIGDDCLIGSNVSIIGSSYKFDDVNIPMRLQGFNSKGVKIGNDVFIGNGACINHGAVIGSGVVVAPNSLVTGRIPENSIIQGAPAKVVFVRR
jgi:acetyltransferase-like isoleucine patch superfamily enzyme